MNVTKALLFLVFLLSLHAVSAQKCATVEVQQNKRKNFKLRESDDQFEKWLSEKNSFRKAARLTASGVYTVPVVVHIIHNGEAIGTGANISDAQINSQIKVLNQDYNRSNIDASNTPAEFMSVAGSMTINFVLATQDPDGNFTNGIVRVKGSKKTWTINDESTLKATSFWPSEDYLNIWVTDLSSSLLGYAQFPVSNLSGLEDAVDNRLTDGVVIDYAVFGSDDDGSFDLLSDFSKGRTATHEIGHFFGLRHIWGDDSGGCSGSDYVSDTPNQADATSGCPVHPQTSCSVHYMFQNYMDYTNDPCMNLFTQGQVERMITVIENSPRRVSLLSSHGSESLPVPNDIGITSIVYPTGTQCVGDVSPQINVKNNGTNDITTADIKLMLNGAGSVTTINFSQPLSAGESATVTLPSITLPSGSNILTVDVESTNNTIDGKSKDNLLQISVYSPYSSATPYEEKFSSFPLDWHSSSGQVLNWAAAVASKETSSNTALELNIHSASTWGESDAVFTPSFDLSTSTSPYLIFDVAYAQSSSFDQDGLKIFAVSGCSDDFSGGPVVYSKTGSALATASITSSGFIPSGDTQWRHEIVDLSNYKDMGSFRFAFAGVNQGGNNIFIDNVRVVESVTTDVMLTDVSNPSPVVCNGSVTATLKIKNTSASTLQSVKVAYVLNKQALQLKSFTGLNVDTGDETVLSIPAISMTDGTNELSFELREPNGLFDINTADNAMSIQSVVNANTDIIPLTQNFDQGLSTWIPTNPSAGRTWQLTKTNYDQSLFFQGTANDTISETWLVSPALDFSSAEKASVFFDVSYQGIVADGEMKKYASDILKVLASADCGVTYEETSFDEITKEMSVDHAVPSTKDQWARKYIDLSNYAGQESVRLAFVWKSGGLNNIYLDNIEMYLSNDPVVLQSGLPYSIYGTDPSSPQNFFITFNLDQRQSVLYSIIDMAGRTLNNTELTNVLNQTYQIVPGVSAGVYVLKLQIGSKVFVSRLFLGN